MLFNKTNSFRKIPVHFCRYCMVTRKEFWPTPEFNSDSDLDPALELNSEHVSEFATEPHLQTNSKCGSEHGMEPDSEFQLDPSAEKNPD